MKSLRFLPLTVALLLAGCQAPTLPNPNDPQDVGNLTADNLAGQMRQIDEKLAERIEKGEITDEQRKKIEKQAAFDLTRGFNPMKIDVTKASVFAHYLVLAEKWSEAKEVAKAAVEQAKASHNEDGRVNNTLQLAEIEAAMGDIDSAVATARTTFNVVPEGAAPILYWVADRIVPAGKGKGKDLQLGELLNDAIDIDSRVIVDPETEGGRNYLTSRFNKVPAAWDLLISLYTDAKRPDLVTKAEKDRDVSLAGLHDTATFKRHEIDPNYNKGNKHI